MLLLTYPMPPFPGVSCAGQVRADATGVPVGARGAEGRIDGAVLAMPATRGVNGVRAVRLEARVGLSGRLAGRSDDMSLLRALNHRIQMPQDMKVAVRRALAARRVERMLSRSCEVQAAPPGDRSL
jgi:hypothetical protein